MKLNLFDNFIFRCIYMDTEFRPPSGIYEADCKNLQALGLLKRVYSTIDANTGLYRVHSKKTIKGMWHYFRMNK